MSLGWGLISSGDRSSSGGVSGSGGVSRRGGSNCVSIEL